MKFISLTKGQRAIVDDEDYELLNQHKWQAVAKTNGFYACRQTELPRHGAFRRRRHIYMHHAIIGGPWKGFEPHHKNGNPLDNRRVNLEKLSQIRHRWTRTKQARDSVSRFMGVSKWGGIWYAQMFRRHKRIRLASFSTEEAAARAFDNWVMQLRGTNARRNFA